MSTHASTTVFRSREEVERLWHDPAHRPPRIDEAQAEVTFKPAPGDRGTEIHVMLADRGGRLGDTVRGLLGSAALPRIKDDLRRFKQRVETGEIPRSDAVPEGETVERKFKRRAAQPLERETAGAQ